MKIDIHQEITDRIIEALEANKGSNRPLWRTSSIPFPLRATGEAYKGINVLLLWIAAQEHGFAAAHWMTYKQAKKEGGQVRKGERSTRIIFYSTIEREVDGQDDPQVIPFVKSYNVFNADQIDGLPEKFRPIPADLGTAPIERIENFFAATGATIENIGDRAFYRKSTDTITMPSISCFPQAHDYYAVLAHETIHWTGASHRLDRFETFERQADYAFEELVAEIGAAFLGAQIPFDTDIERTAAYVGSWLQALKNDKKFIFKAAAQAQKASDYVVALVGDDHANYRMAA
ncbi:MAG: zincin-like metallopeptidase domain-containing protein [Pseudomonadota bacterium]